jgi:predicted NAD/FAD-dependent oxidoreductase
MNALAKHVATDLDVRCESLVFSIHRVVADGGWAVRLDDASISEYDALVMTCPLPQTYSLLISAEVAVPDLLWRTDYERTLGLLAVLDRPTAIAAPGAVQAVVPFQFVADNQAKGISDVPAITAHANAEWSAAHWDDDHATTIAALVELARPYLGDAQIIEVQLKRWRFATPKAIWPEPCWSPDEGLRVVLAGDAFAGPRVEGAALSGLAAAARLAEL